MRLTRQEHKLRKSIEKENVGRKGNEPFLLGFLRHSCLGVEELGLRPDVQAKELQEQTSARSVVPVLVVVLVFLLLPGPKINRLLASET